MRSCGLSLFSIYIYCSYYLTCPLYLFKRFYSKTSKEDKYSNEYKKEYELTEEQKEVLIGLSNQTRFYSTNRKAKKVYNNADIEKELIISNNNGKAGIYMFKNLVNKKRYVGSSVNIRRRMLEYFNINYLESKKYMPICRALLKYGYSNFSLEYPEYCQPSDVISREQYYLDLLKPECNILKTAGSSLGFKQSEETKTKMSAGFANKKG